MGLHLRVRRGIEDPERREVPHRRVGVREIGLDPDRGLALLEAVIEHLLPEFEVLLNGQIPTRAGGLVLLELLELLVVAGTDIRPAPRDQLFAEIIIDREPVALGDDFRDAEAEPLYVFLDGRIGFGVNPLRVGVLDPENVPAAVLLHVRIVQRCRPGMADMERARGVWGEPHHNPFFCTFEVGEPRLLLVLLRKCGNHFRCPGLEGCETLFGQNGSDLGDRFLCERRDFLGLTPEFRVGTHHHADDGPCLRHTAVLHGILECTEEEEILWIVHGHPNDSG